MSVEPVIARTATGSGADQIIKLAVLAVGGQGGGVLTSWIEQLARANGYLAQATSVAGVAQRTGTTVYYIEMMPAAAGLPVFALAPSAGDVDVVIAAEMMEAGRAIQRGFVTPDRTVLIASTHRMLAVSEKSVPGNGIADAHDVRAAADIAAQRLVMADFEKVAIDNGSVISASLFGALAGSGALPFSRAQFEEAIRTSGRSVASSLRAFSAACDRAMETSAEDDPAAQGSRRDVVVTGAGVLMDCWNPLAERVARFPEPVRDMALAGLRKTVDFQDAEYGGRYLDLLERYCTRDDAEHGYELSVEAAKHIANAMAYDDVIRVADLKTRAARFERIRADMGAKDEHLLRLTEYMHPRADEIAGMMPRSLGMWFATSPGRMAWLNRWFGNGRRLRSDGIPSFLMLYLIGGLRRFRLRNLRHAQETRHMDDWLALVDAQVANDYDLAVEMLRVRRLIKGYSDTHSRGQSKFDKVTSAAGQLAGRADASDWVRRLVSAALQDEDGVALDGALATIRSEVLGEAGQTG